MRNGANVPEKALGTSSVLIGAKFDAFFHKFLRNGFHYAFVQSLFFRRGETKGRKIRFWLRHGIVRHAMRRFPPGRLRNSI